MGAEERVGVAVAAASRDLLAYFERRVASREDAADLLGEALLVAWRRAAVVPGDPQGARLWLFGVARNVLANHQRGVRRRLAMADRLRGDDMRELVTLVHWDGFGIAEAGQILGIGASTARSRYARARERLTAELGDAVAAPPERAVSLFPTASAASV